MKKSLKFFCFVLAVIMTAMPVAAFAAYDSGYITGDNVVYEAIKYSTNPQGYGSLRVTAYGSTPDYTLAGLTVTLRKSGGGILATNSFPPTVSTSSNSFTLSDTVGYSGPYQISYTRSDCYYLGTSWYYTSAGYFHLVSGSFD